MNAGLAGIVVGLGWGMALMFLADPAGRARRRQMRDKARRLGHAVGVGFGRRGRRVAARSRQLLARLRHDGRGDRSLSDVLLEQSVRATVSRLCSHPGALELDVRDGLVSMRGPVLSEEAETLLRGVLQIPGVREVADDLDRHLSTGEPPSRSSF